LIAWEGKFPTPTQPTECRWLVRLTRSLAVTAPEKVDVSLLFVSASPAGFGPRAARNGPPRSASVQNLRRGWQADNRNLQETHRQALLLFQPGSDRVPIDWKLWFASDARSWSCLFCEQDHEGSPSHRSSIERLSCSSRCDLRFDDVKSGNNLSEVNFPAHYSFSYAGRGKPVIPVLGSNWYRGRTH
jgi:hypothetical protein